MNKVTAARSSIGAVLSVFLLSACSSTGVIPMDQGTYYISKSSPQVSFGPPVTQKAEIYKEANDFCARQGKSVETIKLEELDQVFGRHASASLTFRCTVR
jgi:hypothetical protein